MYVHGQSKQIFHFIILSSKIQCSLIPRGGRVDCNFSTFEIITFGENFQEFQIGWIPAFMTLSVCIFQTLNSAQARVCTKVVFFFFNSNQYT